MLNPYSYHSPNEGVSFHFTTTHGIEYSLALGDYSDQFGLPDESKCRLLFFLVTRINRPDVCPVDRRIRDTIIQFALDYLAKNPNMIFYVCSNKDEQQNSRQQMFNRWYESIKPSDITKEKRTIDGDETYFLFKSDNAFAAEIITQIDNYLTLG